MTSPMTLSHLTMSDLERSSSRSLRFWNLISCKGAELGHMLLLNINRKAYMESPMTSSHIWPWVTLKGQIQGQSDSEALYLVKELGHMLLWNKVAESCLLSHQLQVSSRKPRSIDLLFQIKPFCCSLGNRQCGANLYCGKDWENVCPTIPSESGFVHRQLYACGVCRNCSSKKGTGIIVIDQIHNTRYGIRTINLLLDNHQPLGWSMPNLTLNA